ncbi:MAG: RNA-binding protein [Bacteriovoracaceae bacterium]|nr:RNA-binding protein [Bacteriovoracaceae bacterium]
MDAKILVENLSFRTDEKKLDEVFRPFGPIREIKIIYDRHAMRSRCFGFITFYFPLDAQKAIEQMDCQKVDGKEINVSIALVRLQNENEVEKKPFPKLQLREWLLKNKRWDHTQWLILLEELERDGYQNLTSCPKGRDQIGSFLEKHRNIET